MPHDANGNLLAAGDEVVLRCKVVRVDEDPDYCNITIETVHCMPPYRETSRYSLNSKQVEKVGMAEAANAPCD